MLHGEHGEDEGKGKGLDVQASNEIVAKSFEGASTCTNYPSTCVRAVGIPIMCVFRRPMFPKVPVIKHESSARFFLEELIR